MADIKELAGKRTTVAWLDPALLKVDPTLNARDLTSPEAEEHIEWLAVSIAETGVKKPLEVFTKGDDVYVSDGHCRLEAVKRANERGAQVALVPCIPETRGVNDARRVLNQNVANSGLKLTPHEERYNIQRAIAFGMSVTEVAKYIGRSASWVTQALEYMEAPAEAHNMVKAGEISATLAQQVVHKEGDKALEVLRAGKENAKERAATAKTGKASSKIRPRDLAPRSTTITKTRQSQMIDLVFRADAIKRPSPSELALTIKDTVILGKNKDWAEMCWAILDLVDPPRKPQAEETVNG